MEPSEEARMRARLAELEAENERLRDGIAAAEQASESKTRFISNVSHEFRTPLSSIIGFASLLEDGAADLPGERRSEYLSIVLQNARHLLHVVNDILNISKVEAGALEVTLAPVRVGDVVASVIAALAPQAEERDVRVRLVDQSSRLARADAGRLRQVLINLLENALKYSPRGGDVEVRVKDSEGKVVVEVEDRGPGIAPEDRGRLFREFSRLNPPGTRVVGAGLGLALSRMLTERMHGRVGVESAPGAGSVFWVALPAAAAGSVPPGPGGEGALPVPTPGLQSGTVAVVDDDPDIRAYVAAVLERAGYAPFADDGAAGVGDRLMGARPGLILLDLNLGGRSGADVLDEIRSLPGLGTVPVLAFTAAAGASLPDTPGRYGFAGRLLKPVEPGVLLARVAEALAEGRGGGPAADAEDDYLEPLRERFRAGLPGRLEAIEAARATRDGAVLLREVHKLRGAAAGFGLGVLSQRAAEAEEALRAGSPDAGRQVRVLVDTARELARRA